MVLLVGDYALEHERECVESWFPADGPASPASAGDAVEVTWTPPVSLAQVADGAT
jgi:hypothetical protein